MATDLTGSMFGFDPIGVHLWNPWLKQAFHSISTCHPLPILEELSFHDVIVVKSRHPLETWKNLISSSKHRGLKHLFERGSARYLTARLVPKIEMILTLMNVTREVEELDVVGFNLHRLKGGLKDFWSVRVTGNWRIIFRFENGNSSDVDLVDYH